MELQINPEDVNRIVADAVLKSAIGDAITKTVAETVAKLSSSYNNPLETVITAHVQTIVRDVIIEQHADAIREKVKEALAKKMTDEFINGIVDAASRKFDRY